MSYRCLGDRSIVIHVGDKERLIDPSTLEFKRRFDGSAAGGCDGEGEGVATSARHEGKG